MSQRDDGPEGKGEARAAEDHEDPASDREAEAGDSEAEESDPDAADAVGESSPRVPASPRARERSAKGGSRNKSGQKRPVAASPSSVSRSAALLAFVAALAAGGAGGWFGHEAHAKADLRRAEAPAGAGAPRGACGDWEQAICKNGGTESAACAQAKGATDLLTSGVCEAAIEAMPATLEKLKEGRAVCDGLVAKLCKELPEGSRTCQMVKERTPSFPRERCDEMLKNFDQVLSEVKMIEQQGAALGASPHGQGHGADDGHGH